MIETTELDVLVQRIINSGELGRSRTYAAILSYLSQCSKTGEAPKEIAIAIDVLGRGTDFDVAKDSIVRVHIFHLRNKLKAYFDKYGKQEEYRLDIPKGQYMLSAVRYDHSAKGVDADEKNVPVINGHRFKAFILLSITCLSLIGLNIYQFSIRQNETQAELNAIGPWQALLDNDAPVIVVMGDYYIFGELDESGNIARMVREFDINSQEDLSAEQARRGNLEKYFNLDLSYIPTSSAFALAQIMPIFGKESSRVSIKMMSELTTADLVTNHIIYLGYLSGLGTLHDLVFAASGLSIGGTYDELYNLETDEYFVSSSGLAIGENSFQDYGMFSTFPSPSGNQFFMIAGMRDEGLINLVQEVTSNESLSHLKRALEAADGGVEELRAYEALYEVVGFDNTNFDADLRYSKNLDTNIIWEARLLGTQER